jgi:hypothetical protein
MKTYTNALKLAVEMMNSESELEPTSALKEAARLNGIPYGDEMGKFVNWANKKLFPDF